MEIIHACCWLVRLEWRDGAGGRDFEPRYLHPTSRTPQFLPAIKLVETLAFPPLNVAQMIFLLP